MFWRKQKEAGTDVGAGKGNRIITVMMTGILFFSVACSPVRQSANDAKQEEEDIDYTLYDLTFVEGIKQKLGGNLGEALDKFTKAIEINPGSDAANYEISQIAAMRRDYKNALIYARRAAELDSSNPWYMMNIANIYIEESKLDSASVWLEKAIELDPGNENEKFRLGNLYLQTGNAADAEKIFTEFYEKYGAGEQIISLLINAKIKLGKYDEAEKMLIDEIGSSGGNGALEAMLAELYREKGESQKAGSLYEKLMKEGGGSTPLRFSYMEFLMEKGEYGMLVKNVEKIRKEGNVPVEEEIGMWMWLIQDTALINAYGNELGRIAEDLWRKHKDEPAVMMTMTEIYAALGETDKELDVMEEYLKRHEENYYIWESFLMKLNENERSDKLFKYAGKASSLFNTAPLPKILYAFSLIEKEMFDEAADELRKVRILVNNEEIYLVQILSMEAEIAYRKGNLEETFEKFDEALQMERKNALILNNYAYYLAEEGIRLGEALTMIEECLEIEENITYLDTQAWVLYKLGRIKEAEKVMERIFGSAKIDDPELLEHFGYIKKSGGKCDEAVALWQLAVKKDRTKTYLLEEIQKCLDRN
ncbi:MAG: tetratricopeptide repeat protein [Bacteroidales bacterium]|jgi:predicted Zn-dependent protease|nr:tetratricopeptide repeat protein [Bacteroidales bacterium]